MKKRRLRRINKKVTGGKLIQFRICNEDYIKLKKQASKWGLPLGSYARLLCKTSKGIKVN